MSVTRLLVLGAVRIFQPAHGYLVMRELQSWQVDEWANLKPGSIYNALRTLTKQALLKEEPSAEPEGKTTYRLTADGETEFQRLVRDAVWQLHPYEPAWLNAGLSFWWAMSRREVVDALEARKAQLLARISGTRYAEENFVHQRGKPVHIVEFFRLHGSELRGELEWVEAVQKRVQDGDFMFADEEGDRFWAFGTPPEA